MDYQQTLEYLYRQLPMFSRVGAAAYKLGLQTSEKLDEFFGHPHRRFKSIHIAGTNGKGSCSHSIAAMLQAQGYKTGLYTSPHLVDFRERIRVNGEMIPKENVVDFMARFLESGYEGKPSFFELTMMMAFDYFARSEVDYAVIEVGMGGRLDSTNIITPEACVITNISKDHTQFLGDTLPKIAGEKAGIIKPGIPVTIGEAEGEVKEVFKRKAQEAGAPITFAEEHPLLAEWCSNTDGTWHCTSSNIGQFDFPLGGLYQIKNINTVLSALDMLRRSGIEISDKAAVKGLQKVDSLTGLRGRWTILANNPLTICDTGHNEAGITSNMLKLKEVMKSHTAGRLRMVIGFVADKDIHTILRLLPADAVYYITNADIPRALPAKDLREECLKAGFDGRVVCPVSEAYKTALADAGSDDVIYIGGSTFVVADLLRDVSFDQHQ